MTTSGKIGVTTENIFPIIKKFLYSDHEIFLRELVANAVDATNKLKTLSLNDEIKGEIGDLKILITLDAENKILKISDMGIGMTQEEVEKYINQIAFSSAGDFLEKYKDKANNIIGHFGLGFYSAFMVAKKVTIDTLSYKEGAEAVKWSCDGSPEYSIEPSERSERGTTITLYLDDDAAEFTNEAKIAALLDKYCKFMPFPIQFGEQTKYSETLWNRKPTELKEEDYLKFYRELYPMSEEPLFYIHLNVDYPFNLTGILYFPKLKDRMSVKKNQISLYCNQMFVTEQVDNIVPEFLTLLQGVIDSPDIPLNVSRSYLQSDSNVKKISTYISKKVADRLEEIFKNDREQFQSKWDNLKLFIEYGMLSDEKFFEMAQKFALLQNIDGKFFTLDEYREHIATNQSDKDSKIVHLYTQDKVAEYQYIQAAQNKGYDVLLMDCELDSHFVNLLEAKLENVRFARVDSDSIENLIPKSEREKLEMSEEQKNELSDMLKALLPQQKEYYIVGDNLGQEQDAIIITQNEFLRRYKEMSAIGGGLNFYGQMPDSYNVIVNMQNPLVAQIMEQKPQIDKDAEAQSKTEQIQNFAKENKVLKQLVDLSLLSSGLLKGKELTDFISRSYELLKK